MSQLPELRGDAALEPVVRRAGRYGWHHRADCGNAGAASLPLERHGLRVSVTVCRCCGRVIFGRVLWGPAGLMGQDAAALWLAQLLGEDVRELLVGAWEPESVREAASAA